MSLPTRSTRRATALALALAVGLLSACSDSGGGDGTAGAATTTSGSADHSDAGHGTASGSSTAPESSTAPGSTAPGSSTAPESSPAPAPSETEAPAAAQTVTATEGEMFIELSESSFSPGSYTIEVVNEGNATHDLVVERDGEDVAGTGNIAPGGSATLTVTLEAGDYVFYCSVGNHRAMGMLTDVTVTA